MKMRMAMDAEPLDRDLDRLRARPQAARLVLTKRYCYV